MLIANLKEFIGDHRPHGPLTGRDRACLERLPAHRDVPLWRYIWALDHTS
jgi:hypothetical protein